MRGARGPCSLLAGQRLADVGCPLKICHTYVTVFDKGEWPQLLEHPGSDTALRGPAPPRPATFVCTCLFHIQCKGSRCWPMANFSSLPGLSFCICKVGPLLLAPSWQRGGADGTDSPTRTEHLRKCLTPKSLSKRHLHHHGHPGSAGVGRDDDTLGSGPCPALGVRRREAKAVPTRCSQLLLPLRNNPAKPSSGSF